MSEATAHDYAREKGVSRPLYVVARGLVQSVLRSWFRVRLRDREHIPAEGGAILAPNHKNFLDPFFIGLANRRPVYYMAKTELLKGPSGWLLSRLGAFPVRRGEADEQALQTARQLLESGELVVIFPEGTRVEEADALGSPHHGAGRLAVETGVPIIPVAISGTSHLWRGALPRAKRVQLTFLPAISPWEIPEGAHQSQALIDERVWPAVQEEYGRLRAAPGLILAGLAALGIGGGLIARRQLEARRPPRLLGVVAPRRVRRKAARRWRLPRPGKRLLAKLRKNT
jgi:1-acyl-sn-glycerol-3-phosphate acyltransferase